MPNLTTLPTPTSFLTSLPLSDSLYSSFTTLTSVFPSPISSTDIPWKTAAITLGLGYLGLCQLLRFRHEKAMRRRFGYTDRESLRNMTVEDAQKIIDDLAVWEFPQFMLLSLQFGLFKTYGVETISRLLVATKGLTHPVNSWKRYEDTAVMIGEFTANPPNSNRATMAVARMNWLHSKYIASGAISNTDMVYTLSVFITEPERFARLYEWRPLNDMEFCALGAFWKSMGDTMGMKYEGLLSQTEWADGLEFAQDIARWAKKYEVEAFVPSPISNVPAVTLVPILTYWVPSWAKGFVGECVNVLLGDRVREAFMLPEPGLTPAVTTYAALAVRRFVLRHLSLPRFIPVLRHAQKTDDIEKPLHMRSAYGNVPFYVKPNFWSRWGPEALAIWLGGGVLPGVKPEEHLAKGFMFGDLGPRNRMNQGQEAMEKDFANMKRRGMGGCPFG